MDSVPSSRLALFLPSSLPSSPAVPARPLWGFTSFSLCWDVFPSYPTEHILPRFPLYSPCFWAFLGVTGVEHLFFLHAVSCSVHTSIKMWVTRERTITVLLRILVLKSCLTYSGYSVNKLLLSPMLYLLTKYFYLETNALFTFKIYSISFICGI